MNDGPCNLTTESAVLGKKGSDEHKCSEVEPKLNLKVTLDNNVKAKTSCLLTKSIEKIHVEPVKEVCGS